MRTDILDLVNADPAAVADAPERRIVLTHGTDTMMLTAGALSGIAEKTVVLTGILVPARFAATDPAV